MTPAAGPFAIAAALLAAGGALKALHPQETANALRAVGIPAPRVVVRVGGTAEALIGAAAFVRGDRVTALVVAASYSLFIGFVVLARRLHTPIASCGCFGKLDTPPTGLHVAINLAALVAAVAVAVEPNAGLGDVLSKQPLGGGPYVLLVGMGVAFSFLALSRVPRTLALVRQSQGAQ